MCCTAFLLIPGNNDGWFGVGNSIAKTLAIVAKRLSSDSEFGKEIILNCYKQIVSNIFSILCVIGNQFWKSYNTSLGTFPAGELVSDDTGKLLCDGSQRNCIKF